MSNSHTGTENQNQQSRLIRDPNLHIIFAVTLMAVLGVSSLTPVLPKVIEAFDITRQQVTLLITAFTLPGAIFGLFYGILADRLGRKRILVPSLFLFGIAGAACGLARDFTLLIILRFVQGIGAGILGTMGSTIIGDMYEGPRQLKAMGMNSSVLSIATAAFPAIGGLLAVAHWSLPFYMPVAAIPIGIWVILGLNAPEPHRHESLKKYLSGAFTGVFTGRILALFGLGLLTFTILFGPFLTFFPLWISDRNMGGPLTIGLLFSTSSLISAFVSWQLGWLGRRIKIHRLLILAFFIYTLAMILIPTAGSVWLLLIPMAMFGIAQALNIPTLVSMVAASAPMQYRGAFMATNAVVFRIGQTIGPPLAALVYTWRDMKNIYYFSAIATLFTAFLLVFFSRRLLTPRDVSHTDTDRPGQGT